MDYVLHLSKDKKFKQLFAGGTTHSLKKKKHLCVYLCGSIMSQQLSTKVAAVIYDRFLALYDNKIPTAAQIEATPFETLRGIGLSNAKVNYIQNVARFDIEHGINYTVLNKMDNEAIITYLTQIKGVGRWTVEMMLMFALCREDVFAVDDLGIQQAMVKLYKLNTDDKKALKQDMLRISQKWSPYRTYACLHLWRWKDNTPDTASKKPAAAKGKNAG